MIKRPKFNVKNIDGKNVVVPSAQRVNHEEDKVQRPIVTLLRMIEDYTSKLAFFHVPNQMMRNKTIRKIFWALGVRAGVPDVVIPIEAGKTLWIECKYDGNKLSDDQSKFITKLENLGHIVYIIDAKNPRDAQDQMLEILKKHGIEDFRLTSAGGNLVHVKVNKVSRETKPEQYATGGIVKETPVSYVGDNPPYTVAKDP